MFRLSSRCNCQILVFVCSCSAVLYFVPSFPKLKCLSCPQAFSRYSLAGFCLFAYKLTSITNIYGVNAMEVALLARCYSSCAYCISQHVPHYITKRKYSISYQVPVCFERYIEAPIPFHCTCSVLPVLIHSFCKAVSRSMCNSQAKSQQFIYAVAAKGPASPGINVCGEN